MRVLVIALLLLSAETFAAGRDADPFAPLALYNGRWTIRAAHPWSGRPSGGTDQLDSRCHRFTVYFSCEQSVNGKVLGLLVYTADGETHALHSRFISPEGLAGGRGDVTVAGSHFTYLDKPPATLKGKWSRTENHIIDHDHIRFEEYESDDEGRTWTKVNEGTEERIAAGKATD